MSVPPLIADDSYTCHLPKDTDEDKFNPESSEAPITRSDAAHPFSYFLQRIRYMSPILFATIPF